MKIKPLPGYMLVKLESLYKDTGLIRVPERFKRAPHLIGTIVELSMTLDDRRALGVELRAGNRIIVTPLGGREIGENLWIYPITMIRRDERNRKYRDSGVLAIVPETVNLGAHVQDIERCQYCGEARTGAKQNMMLWNGVCPRCGKNRNGEIPDGSVKVTDEEVERFMETGMSPNVPEKVA